MDEEQTWPNLHSFRKKFPVRWGAANMLLLRWVTAARGLVAGPALQYGYKYSQTCIYKENIKICTVANFQCVLSCRKTPIKVCKNSFVKKSEKAFLGNSASKAHLKYQDTLPRSTPTPNRWRTKLWKCVPSTQQFFLWQVSGSSGMPVKLVTLYI